ncbi:MAG: NDMA-dependent alcohol dehydrogenase [Acidimicrobiales bacterium]
MLTDAAVLWELHEPWSVEEVELGDPVTGEVKVKLAATGLCHSDEHLVTGDLLAPLPVVGGHEGAGVVEEVGPEVHGLRPGDHVVLSFVPACGRCVPCSSGRQNLCDLGAHLLSGRAIADGTARVHAKGRPAATMCLLGSFSPYVVVHESSVVRIEEDLPLDRAALVGCGVTTGWGAAVHAARVQPGDTVVVVGCGGVGVNALQGARLAGAERIFAVDPVPARREESLRFGATHVASSLGEAYALVSDATRGRLADKAIIATSVVTGELIAPTMSLVAKGGRAVVVGIAPLTQIDVKLSLFELAMFQKELRGTIFGSANPRVDIPMLLDLYRAGRIDLDHLVTRTYRLSDINQGFADLREGKNLRGLLTFG